MTRSLGVLAVMLLAVAVTSAQDRSATRPTLTADAAIVANERALHEAAVKGDKTAFTALVVPEGVWTTPSGFVPMNLLVNGLASFSGITTWEMVNPRVTWLDEESAMVHYTRTATGTFQNQVLAPMALCSTTWVRRQGKWLAVHHQETDLVQ